MSTKHFLSASAAAVLLMAGATAQAGTVSFTNWAYPGGNVVSVTGHANQAAGGFAISLTGFGAFDGAFESYCVELTEHIGLRASYPSATNSNSYTIVSAADYFATKAGVAARLKDLISYVKGASVFENASDESKQSTALQLAIWNTVYDTDSTLNGSNGALFSETNGSYRSGATGYAGADALLSGSVGYSSRVNYELFVLSSGKPYADSAGQQDQLIWRQTVPEPASLALVGLALGGAAFASRRRRG